MEGNVLGGSDGKVDGMDEGNVLGLTDGREVG